MKTSLNVSDPTITVFTPTFNRAALLPRAYGSLLAQSQGGFEWLIVDDGSTDGTPEVVWEWVGCSPFPIRYVRQENAGKHVAVNRGVRLAHGGLFLILDSDDWLVPNAIERVRYWWLSIPEGERESFAGVAGLCALPSGEIVGNRFRQDVLDSNPIEIRTKYAAKGDKCEVWRTDVLRKFPFPEDLGRFVTEGLVWNRIARHYRVRYVNEVWMITEYQPHGLSARSLELRASSPHAARLYYKEFAETVNMEIPIVRRMREYANWVRFSLHGGVLLAQQAGEARFKFLWSVVAPVGVMLYLRDLIWLRFKGRRR